MPRLKTAPAPRLVQINTRLPVALHDRLIAEAERDGVHHTEVFKSALRFYFNAEDSMQAVLAAAVAEDHVAAVLRESPTAFLVWLYQEYFGPVGRFTERLRPVAAQTERL